MKKHFVDNYIAKGFFKCRNESIYLSIEQVCDEKIDCQFSSDEINCNHDQLKIQNYSAFWAKPLNYVITCEMSNEAKNNISENITVKEYTAEDSFAK